MLFDLHVHTNCSDGLFPPEKVVDLAIEANLDGIAITDHDTITGIEIAINHSNKYDNFTVIPGIEFGTIFMDEEVHILGYFINYKDPKIIETTNLLKQSRLIRGEKIIEKINNLGFKISIEEVKELSGEKYIGRPHIARVMLNKGYISSLSEGFEKYLNRGMPAYVERYKISTKETINLIQDSGGFAILAHPGLLKNPSIIDYCISQGIDGIECIHSKHSEEAMNTFLEIAKSNNLIATAGSDFHGDSNNGDKLLGKYCVNIENIPEFKGRI